jgi:hypothetical protein
VRTHAHAERAGDREAFPTCTGILGRASAIAARTLGRDAADTRFADQM